MKAEVEDLAWTLVVNAEHPKEASDKAELAVLKYVQTKGILKPGMYVRVCETKPGVPSSMALYSWTDMREAA
ncbi:hypothetical protein [Streptomyces sp. NPDC005281]|uniref:hypothetical protein n=1 Tax=Streptomyces sp. NPDC005281 TaxID=3155712 RepID=UPI0033A72AC8